MGNLKRVIWAFLPVLWGGTNDRQGLFRLQPEERRVVGRGELEFHRSLPVDRRLPGGKRQRRVSREVGAFLRPDGQLELAAHRVLGEQGSAHVERLHLGERVVS